MYVRLASLVSQEKSSPSSSSSLTTSRPRSILFVKPTQAPLKPAVVDSIKLAIRQALSTRHVPAKVIELQKIPYTGNGKRLEVPTKKLVNGVKFESLNLSSAEDPECLRVFVNHPELRLEDLAVKAKL